jgi:lipoprotein NlpD
MKNFGGAVLSTQQPCGCVDTRLTRVSKVSRRVWVIAAVLALSACSSRYQAPVDDRSSRLERETPIIIVDGQVVPASTRAPVASTSSASSNSSAVGASSTVVRPVAVGSGISRSSVTRAPATAADAARPQTSQPQTTQSQATQAPLTQAPAVNEAGAVHVVARGDTLYSIAFVHNMDVRNLALANNLATPYTIYPGQRLSLSASAVSASALDAVPRIPAAPAGEAAPDTGRRPQAAIDARRTGSVNTRDVDGVLWQWPADGRLLSTFSEASAVRGIDIAGSRGQSVYAAADGDVVYAGSGIQGAGNLVIVRHNDRHLSAYMHNSAMLVAEGDRVRAGDKIAEIGPGPNGREMLHFEVRVDGKPVDPVRYLPQR